MYKLQAQRKALNTPPPVTAFANYYQFLSIEHPAWVYFEGFLFGFYLLYKVVPQYIFKTIINVYFSSATVLSVSTLFTSLSFSFSLNSALILCCSLKSLSFRFSPVCSSFSFFLIPSYYFSYMTSFSVAVAVISVIMPLSLTVSSSSSLFSAMSSFIRVYFMVCFSRTKSLLSFWLSAFESLSNFFIIITFFCIMPCVLPWQS